MMPLFETRYCELLPGVAWTLPAALPRGEDHSPPRDPHDGLPGFRTSIPSRRSQECHP